MKGFAVDANVPVDVAGEVARQVENLGYDSFWVNGSPHEGALAILESASSSCSLDLGVGVFPLTEIGADQLVSQVRLRDLPEDRLWVGIGSHRTPGALAEVRDAVGQLRSELDCRVVTAAVGPRMTSLAGEIADAVIFTWWFVAEVERSRRFLEEGAARARREPPSVISYIRCALLPQAADTVAKRVAAYSAIPRYLEVFERNQMTAADAVVTGISRAELLQGITKEEAVVDLPLIRAIPEAATVDSIMELARACAP